MQSDCMQTVFVESCYVFKDETVRHADMSGKGSQKLVATFDVHQSPPGHLQIETS